MSRRIEWERRNYPVYVGTHYRSDWEAASGRTQPGIADRPQYESAKFRADVDAALIIVRRSLSHAYIQNMKILLNEMEAKGLRRPVLVAPYRADSKNVIARTAAAYLGEQLGLDVCTDIIQLRSSFAKSAALKGTPDLEAARAFTSGASNSSGRRTLNLPQSSLEGASMQRINNKLREASAMLSPNSASGIPKFKSQREKSPFERMQEGVAFAGTLLKGTPVIGIDDMWSTGGTLAGLRSHIDRNGGRYLFSCVLASKDGHHTRMNPLPEQVEGVYNNLGEKLIKWVVNNVGLEIPTLTGPEARFLASRGGVSEVALRARLAPG